MKNLFIGIALVGLVSCGGAGGVDQSTPEGTVQAVFDAAKSGEMAGLKDLCDPEGDRDVKRICDCAAEDSKDKEELKEYFAKGSVNGTAEVDGDNAKVKIKFGPEGDKDETIKMIKKDGKWLMSSM